MATTHELADRLAELVWRTIKLRISLLVVACVVLLIVWSALSIGDHRAQEIDAELCRQLVDESNEPVRPPLAPVLSADIFCAPNGARSYIEAGRASNEMFSPAYWSRVGQSGVSVLSQRYKDKLKQFAEYDAKRRTAYRLDIQLSSQYSSGNIVVNALSVAEVVPFCILVLLAIVLLLGFQQASYKSQLQTLLANSKEDSALASARSQFFVWPPSLTRSRATDCLVLSPDGMAMLALFAAILYLLGGVLSAFIPNVAHLTESIFFNYVFVLYSAAFVITCLLIVSRRFYLRPTPPFVPSVVGNDNREQSRGWQQWLMVALALIGFGSLLLPWARGLGSIPALDGYQFLVKQDLVREFGDVRQYPIDPRLFRAMRVQVAIALLFLLVCGVDAALWDRLAASVARAGRGIRAMLGVATLFLCLNFLLYMGILEYQSEVGTPWLFTNVFSQALLEHSTSYSIVFYDPAYGFLIFLACCLVLVWLSLRRGTWSHD